MDLSLRLIIVRGGGTRRAHCVTTVNTQTIQVADLEPTMEPTTESQAYPFTPAEFDRLAVFRQAVLAGFYTDQLHDDEAARSRPAPSPR